MLDVCWGGSTIIRKAPRSKWSPHGRLMGSAAKGGHCHVPYMIIPSIFIHLFIHLHSILFPIYFTTPVSHIHLFSLVFTWLTSFNSLCHHTSMFSCYDVPHIRSVFNSTVFCYLYLSLEIDLFPNYTNTLLSRPPCLQLVLLTPPFALLTPSFLLHLYKQTSSSIKWQLTQYPSDLVIDPSLECSLLGPRSNSISKLPTFIIHHV